MCQAYVTPANHNLKKMHCEDGMGIQHILLDESKLCPNSEHIME